MRFSAMLRASVARLLTLGVGLLVFSLAALLPNPANAAPLLSGLIAWWSAEGNANDIQSGNDGQMLGGANYAPGKVGQAFSFNDDTGEISIRKTSILNLGAKDFSIEAWIKMTRTPQASSLNGSYPVFLNYAGVPTYMLMVTAAGFKGQVYFRPGNPNASCTVCPYAEAVGTKSLNDGKWHHLVGVRSGATASIYVDGVLDSSATNPATNPAVLTVNGGSVDVGCLYARIGAIHTDTGNCTSAAANKKENHFPGLIDEVRLFNRALSAAEVLSLSKWACPD